MANDIPCDVERFAATVGQLLGDVADSCDKEVEKAVTKSVRGAAKDLREKRTENIGRSPEKHPWSDEYRQGFASHVDKNGLQTVGEVGNRNKPGLVHLLEKGHLTLTGRRTNAYPHMEPAFQDMEEKFVDEVEEALDRAVS